MSASPEIAGGPALLDVRDLRIHFQLGARSLRAVDGLSFQVHAGETLAIVGESGCGKTATAMAVMRLLPEPLARITGSIHFRGRNLLDAGRQEMRALRGSSISMIFQEPMTSLNPVFTVGWQIGETLHLHETLSRRAARRRAEEMLELVGIPEPARRLDQYPHQLSGGQRQRVMIAMALACRPALLIADEPTTALDVTIQAQILDLLRQLQRQFELAMILVTHDFGVVATMADRVVVMYAGRMAEEGPTGRIFERPLHPYTRGLIAAIPRSGRGTARLTEIPGSIPDPTQDIPGCVFASRCPHAVDDCRALSPMPEELEPGHVVACHRARSLSDAA